MQEMNICLWKYDVDDVYLEYQGTAAIQLKKNKMWYLIIFIMIYLFISRFLRGFTWRVHHFIC